MTPTNTYTSLYVRQNWSNIRSLWPNYALAKLLTHCLGGLSPAVVIVAVTLDYVDETDGHTDLDLSSDT